jgi:hypothetical protein
MKSISVFLPLIVLLIIAGGAAKDRTENASTLLELIKNNSSGIDCDGKVIEGDFDLHLIGQMSIEKPISFKNSIFNGEVNLSNIREFNGRVIFDNAIFNNNVNISNAHFYKEVEFYNSTFTKNFDSYDANFERLSNFSNSNFEGVSDFSYATFNNSADFGSAKFDDVTFSSSNFKGSYANFEGSRFYNSSLFDFAFFSGSADFANAAFGKTESTSLKSCTFSKHACFKNCTFNNMTFFEKSKFLDGCDFSDSIFKGSAYLYLIQFNKSTDLSRTKFYRDASFQSSSFADDPDFSDATFYGNNANYIQTQFLGHASFERSQFKGNADFSSSQFDKNAYFYSCLFNESANFKNANFAEDAFFEGSRVNGTLDLTKMEYKTLYIRLDNIKNIEYNETAYKTLIDNFKKIGFFSDAYGCYYRFMKAYAYENLLGFNGVEKLNDWASNWGENPVLCDLCGACGIIGSVFVSIYYLCSWMLYGFGTKPDFTMIWSLLLITLFGFFWYHTNKVHEENVIKNRSDEYDWKECWHNQEPCLREKTSEITDALMFSATIFLSGTKFFIDPPKIPESLEGFTPWVNRAYMIERVLGGIFSLLFIISIGSIILSM